MSQGERCLLVHGHFYQPPRENPWTGAIDPQYSAAPWENWNSRIADECYVPMARSRVYNAHGQIGELYNNYAHTSFNFGPTLLSWAAGTHPELIRHLREAALFDHTFAMAQAYNHMMLPLADARDRHAQIIWGLREFHHRFGFYPAGMWLPECGIDPETVRALIDRSVRYVILSPNQASVARPFGQAEWRDVSMGSIDTRRAYRLFETDLGGRTHFDRSLDIIFYTPGLNLKVSFDHLLNRPDDLAREIEACYKPDLPGAQLVSIVTDGEIYGHHEKSGEIALSRLYRTIAPELGLKIVSAGGFIRDNPPSWEVKLWNGEEGRGSSWSCSHGMGRWFRDCGCTPPAPKGWNQRWRGPLRDAFDLVRGRVRQVARRELAPLLWDVHEARNDYISVILRPEPESRLAYIRRHARRELTLEEIERLWRIMEALHNAMLMYASCGWFFDELSGLEPVQNMRYALRAAELVQPWQDGDPALLLEQELAAAKSNLPEFADGGGVFRKLVLPSRHSVREIAGGMAICLAAGLPADRLGWQLADRTGTVAYSDNQARGVSWGSFVCRDERLDRFIRTSWVARLDDFDNSGVGLYGYEEIQGDPAREPGTLPFAANPDFSWLRDMESETRRMKRQELLDRFGKRGISIQRVPEAIRGMLYRRFSGEQEAELMEEAARLGARAVPFLNRARKNQAPVPGHIAGIVTNAFEQEMHQVLFEAVGAMSFGDDVLAAFRRPLDAAAELGLGPDLEPPRRYIYLVGLEILEWLGRLSEPEWFASLVPLALEDGKEWLPPRARHNRIHGYPSASAFALALGMGLAKLRRALAGEADPGPAALVRLPALELAEFSSRAGFDLRQAILPAIEFWDFLGLPLARLIAGDPAGLMAGEAGDRLRKIGALCGFAPETLEKRIQTTVRTAMDGGTTVRTATDGGAAVRTAGDFSPRN